MLNQSLSYKAVRALGKGTWKKHDPNNDYDNFIENTYLDIEKKLVNGGYNFSPFKSKNVNGKKGYDFIEPSDELVCKKLNDNIRRLFKVMPSDRHAIIKQVVSLSKDSQPVTIARLDIKEFYESIERGRVIKFISEQWLLSQQNRIVLKAWDNELNKHGINGLPRGMALSSTISEIKIRSFDKAMKYERDVYYYARYVDDIIIFYSGSKQKLENVLQKNLEKTATELSLNKDKCRIYELNKIESPAFHELDYLGYKITISAIPTDINKMRNVEVHISEKKINKIKFRIRRAFCSYARERNFNLLYSRLKFLSGNQYIIGDIDRTKLKSGIYYNYPLITDFKQLKELDDYYQKLLRCTDAPVGLALKMIKNHSVVNVTSRYEKICSISFHFGFHKKIMNSFTASDSKKIKRCW